MSVLHFVKTRLKIQLTTINQYDNSETFVNANNKIFSDVPYCFRNNALYNDRFIVDMESATTNSKI